MMPNEARHQRRFPPLLYGSFSGELRRSLDFSRLDLALFFRRNQVSKQSDLYGALFSLL